jgi:hypothetical protein
MPGVTSNTPVKILIMFILLKNGEFCNKKLKSVFGGVSFSERSPLLFLLLCYNVVKHN